MFFGWDTSFSQVMQSIVASFTPNFYGVASYIASATILNVGARLLFDNLNPQTTTVPNLQKFLAWWTFPYLAPQSSFQGRNAFADGVAQTGIKIAQKKSETVPLGWILRPTDPLASRAAMFS